MNWIFASAQEGLEGARDRWDELNAAHANRILFDSLFVDRPNGQSPYVKSEFPPRIEVAYVTPASLP
jgi:hypothetical protein